MKGLIVRSKGESFAEPQRVKKYLSLAAKQFGGKRVRISIEPVSSRRNLAQNAYYWGVIVPFVKDLFFESGSPAKEEDIHHLLKIKCLGERKIVDPETGEIKAIPPSTKTLTKGDFSDYIETIREFTLRVFNQDLPECN